MKKKVLDSWVYKEKSFNSISSLDDDIIGFVYRIENTLNGTIYIGKKILFNSRRSRLSKREKITTKSRKTFKTVIKESDWLNYYGSSIRLKNDILLYGKENFKREILEFTSSKKKLSYLEVKYMFKYEVLEKNTYNDNILSRFFRRDLE